MKYDFKIFEKMETILKNDEAKKLADELLKNKKLKLEEIIEIVYEEFLNT